MNFRQLFLAFSFMLPLVSFAQTEPTDSIRFDHVSTDNKSIDNNVIPDSISDYSPELKPLWRYNTATDPMFPYRMVNPLYLRIPDLDFTPGQARVANWGSGEMLATGAVTRFPGMMQVESGSIGVYQNVGRFSFYGGALANKYGYFLGLTTQYGVNGSVSFRMVPNATVSFFGTYYFGRAPYMANGMPMPPSMVGYFGRSKFGGTFDVEFDEHWGIEAGAQAVQQFGTKKYEFEPIATPYYKIGKKVKIGLPVGQILYHILKK